MNKLIDFEKLGGYPLAQEDLDWLQTSYRSAFASLAELLGDKVILSGMTETGGVVSNGWISIGGELMPFIGGTIDTGDCIIEETKESLTFQDASVNEVLITRVARFGSPDPAFNYADLTRPGTVKEIWQSGDIKMLTCDDAYITANFDVTGLGINKRKGWAKCNGNNGTPNMGGKFPVGYNAADGDYDEVGKIGGEKTHVLTVTEMPAHQHFVVKAGNGGNALASNNALAGQTNSFSDSNYITRSLAGNADIGLSSSVGGGTAHENRPPFYTLLFIMKL